MSVEGGRFTSGDASVDDESPASLLDALLVYVEALAQSAHVVVIGDAESAVAPRLLDLGARSVHVFDPDPARAANAAQSTPRGVTVRAFVDDLDVRDGAFDLAVVPDLAELNDPAGMITRLRRAVADGGAVVAMGRAKLEDEGEETPFPAALGPAALDYPALYDLFASQFEEVSLAGVVPFSGVVFAELGDHDDDSPPVSVDTRLAPASAPRVFVVVASSGADREAAPYLDPYAIVQISEQAEPPPVEALAAEVALGAIQLKVDLLTAQLEEAVDRLTLEGIRSSEVATRLDRTTVERDGALTRAMELEAVLAASQMTLSTLERRLLEAEQGMLERDDRIATLSAELDERRSSETPFFGVPTPVDLSALVTRAERAEQALAVAITELAERQDDAATTVHLNADNGQLRARAERAEAALAIHVEDLTHVAEAHGLETSNYEEQLRDRARVIAGLERELTRREELVKELVGSLAESRETAANGALVFEAAPPVSRPVGGGVDPDDAALSRQDEVIRLERKLDELAGEVARREGELVARGWRITELENENTRLARAPSAGKPGLDMQSGATANANPTAELRAELARTRDELDALRQALTQEHAARIAAESGEELVRARSELARQAVLLEQIRTRAG